MTNRVYAQYADKPKALAWFDITHKMLVELESAAQDVADSYNIDTAKSESLDVIGEIVDIDRGYESQIVINGLQWGQPSAQYGGAYIQYQPTGKTLSDEVTDAIFRALIKAKIVKNNSFSTLDDIARGLTFITGSQPVQVIDNEDMTFSVSFGQELDSISKFVLERFDITPRPQGVRFLGFTEEPSVTQYGGNLCWGDIRAQYSLYFGAK